MAQNIKIAGASYSSVPAIDIPKTSGGTARFIDTSDATASADKILEGYTAYVNGQKVVGTATEGGGGQYTIYSGTEEPSAAQNGDIWIDVSGDIPSAGSDIYVYHGMDTSTRTSLTATNVSVQVEKAGNYKVSWIGARNNNQNTFGSRLYINGSAYSDDSEHTSFTNSYFQECIINSIALSAGDILTIYARARSTSYYMMVGNLIAEKLP